MKPKLLPYLVHVACQMVGNRWRAENTPHTV